MIVERIWHIYCTWTPANTNTWYDLILDTVKHVELEYNMRLATESGHNWCDMSAGTRHSGPALFIDMPPSIVSDRDPFWQVLFSQLDTRLVMSTAYKSKMDGQAEQVNRAVEDVLSSHATSFTSRSRLLLMV